MLVAELSFFHCVSGFSCRDCVECGHLGTESPLLLLMERSHLKWFLHLCRIPLGCLSWGGALHQRYPPRGTGGGSWGEGGLTISAETAALPVT